MKGKGWDWRKWEEFICELCDLVEGPSFESMSLDDRLKLLRAQAEKVGAQGVIDKLGKYYENHPSTP